jgi:hypothetical protein
VTLAMMRKTRHLSGPELSLVDAPKSCFGCPTKISRNGQWDGPQRRADPSRTNDHKDEKSGSILNSSGGGLLNVKTKKDDDVQIVDGNETSERDNHPHHVVDDNGVDDDEQDDDDLDERAQGGQRCFHIGYVVVVVQPTLTNC